MIKSFQILNHLKNVVEKQLLLYKKQTNKQKLWEIVWYFTSILFLVTFVHFSIYTLNEGAMENYIAN